MPGNSRSRFEATRSSRNTKWLPFSGFVGVVVELDQAGEEAVRHLHPGVLLMPVRVPDHDGEIDG